MADTTRTLLNPVLKLLVKPKRETPSVGGGKRKIRKESDSIEHREALSGQLNNLYQERARMPTFGGKMQLVASMFDSARVKTLTPTDLFSSRNGAQLIAPLSKGYLVETDVENLRNFNSLYRVPGKKCSGQGRYF